MLGGIIALLVTIGVCIAALYFCQQKPANNEKVNKEEKELVLRYLEWWLNSKFNEFEVVKKYTTMLSKEDRYRVVIRQVLTDTYTDERLSVTSWYRWKEGAILVYPEAPMKYYLQTDSIEEFNKVTDSKLTCGLVYCYFAQLFLN